MFGQLREPRGSAENTAGTKVGILSHLGCPGASGAEQAEAGLGLAKKVFLLVVLGASSVPLRSAPPGPS